MEAMVVILAGPRLGKGRRLAALARREKTDRVNFMTIRPRRVRAAGQVVRDHIVIDERDRGPTAIVIARGSIPLAVMLITVFPDSGGGVGGGVGAGVGGAGVGVLGAGALDGAAGA